MNTAVDFDPLYEKEVRLNVCKFGFLDHVSLKVLHKVIVFLVGDLPAQMGATMGQVFFRLHFLGLLREDDSLKVRLK